MGSAIKSEKTPATSQPLPPHPVLDEFYRAPSERARFVRGLFDDSARYYDGLSAALSFGTDRRYRKMVLRQAGLRPGMKLLDVATGTGLIARAALELGLGTGDILGLDPSGGMLRENQRRNRIPVVQGIGERLPVPDAAFDLIAMGYALRHVEDLNGLFDEFHRVLRPGGRVVVLELSRPNSRFGFASMRLFMQKALAPLVRLVTRRTEPARLMEYYWATIAECVPAETILSALRHTGFINVTRQRLGGVLNNYLAEKQR